MVLDKFVALGGLEDFADHFGDEFVEGDLGHPAEFFLGDADSARPPARRTAFMVMIAVPKLRLETSCPLYPSMIAMAHQLSAS